MQVEKFTNYYAYVYLYFLYIPILTGRQGCLLDVIKRHCDFEGHVPAAACIPGWSLINKYGDRNKVCSGHKIKDLVAEEWDDPGCVLLNRREKSVLVCLVLQNIILIQRNLNMKGNGEVEYIKTGHDGNLVNHTKAVNHKPPVNVSETVTLASMQH